MPAFGLSLILVAVGAILAFAVEWTMSGVDLATVGLILMGVGTIGAVMSMLFLTSFAPYGRRDHDIVTHDIVTHDGQHT